VFLSVYAWSACLGRDATYTLAFVTYHVHVDVDVMCGHASRLLSSHASEAFLGRLLSLILHLHALPSPLSDHHTPLASV
jgi:hypothetical protein